MTRVTAEKVTTGGCLCGGLRFTARGEPYRVGLCHCLDCRKNHGALFHGSAIFPETAVTVTGEARDYQRRFFCPTCGSPVYAHFDDEIGDVARLSFRAGEGHHVGGVIGGQTFEHGRALACFAAKDSRGDV